MVDPKRPSGSRVAVGRRMTIEDLDFRLQQIEALAEKFVPVIERNTQRITVIDGNGNPMAEGGFIGRMKREHDQNQRLLKRIIWLAATANLGLWADFVVHILKGK